MTKETLPVERVRLDREIVTAQKTITEAWPGMAAVSTMRAAVIAMLV